MTAMALRLALILCLAIPPAAFAARSDWAAADQSKVRLLLSAAGDGRIEGGLEVLLRPGWHTYWRNPGESGVPPVFDFSKSDNVADVDVLYPAPERYDDGTSVSLVYRDEVVFPLIVTPLEAGEPVILRVVARYGVCSSVCIPTQARAELPLPPSSQFDPLTEARLQRFRTRVPKAPTVERFDIEEVATEGNALLIDVRMPDSSYSDLFVDPPTGWYVGQPEFLFRADGVSRYRLSLAGRPRHAAVAGQTFRFVAVAGGEAIEEAVAIP